VGVLFADDETIEYDEKALKKVLRKNDNQGFDVLVDLREQLGQVEWTAEAIEAFLRGYAERNQLGMGKVAQPIRVAVTGSTVSPAIGETLELLGRDKTLRRIDRCLTRR
jgi:glutamyl-tRNA synthetase